MGLEKVLCAILGSPGSNSSLRKLKGWKSQIGMSQPRPGENGEKAGENDHNIQKVDQ